MENINLKVLEEIKSLVLKEKTISSHNEHQINSENCVYYINSNNLFVVSKGHYACHCHKMHRTNSGIKRVCSVHNRSLSDHVMEVSPMSVAFLYLTLIASEQGGFFKVSSLL